MSTEPPCPARGMRAVRALSCALPEPEGTAPPRTRLLQAAPFRRERGARASRGQSSDPAEMLPSGQGRTPEVCARVKATWAGQGVATPGSQPPAPCEMTSCHLGRPPEASCHEQTKTNAVSAGSTIQVKWPIP